MKVIFLDFDGVINDVRTRIPVEEKHVQILKEIINQTGAKIVVTSANKNKVLYENPLKYANSSFYNQYVKPLKEMGIELDDCTTYVSRERCINRELEIEIYLRSHPEIKEFVIIEDDYVIDKYSEHQVFIEYANGLSEEHIEPAINILNGNLGFYPPTYDKNESLEKRVKRIFTYK